MQYMQEPVLQQSKKIEFSSISAELNQLFIKLQSNIKLLIVHYQPYILKYQHYLKLTLLLIIVYIFYQLGTKTVSDKIQSKKKQLKLFINKRKYFEQELPKKITKIKSNTNKILVFIMLFSFGYAYIFFTDQQISIDGFQTHLMIGGSVIIIYLVYSNILKIILSKRLRQVTKIENCIEKKLSEFVDALGPKVTAILKNHLCQQLLLKYNSEKSINQCRKINCKQLRSLIKQKNDVIAALVEQTIDFQWCSTCKKRLPFDQYLNFQVKPYQQLQTENQLEELKKKLSYLLDGLERMRKWLSQTFPCNCSKLYWAKSTNQIREFKNTQKQINTKIKFLESKRESLL